MRLGARDKVILTFLLPAAIIAASYLVFISPRQARLKQLERLVLKEQKEKEELTRLRDEYLTWAEKKKKLETLLSRGDQKISLFAFLQQEASRLKLEGKIRSMRPQTFDEPRPRSGVQRTLVEMRLEEVNAQELVNYLALIEAQAPQVAIDYLSIRSSSRNPGQLEATVKVSSWLPSPKGQKEEGP